MTKSKFGSLALATVAIAFVFATISSCKLPMNSEKETTTTITTGETAGPADATAYATVAGYVVDGAGKPFPGVTVAYNTGVNSKALASVLTDANGWFEVAGLISGDHTIMVGNGVSSTMQSLSVVVPKLADLKNDSTPVPVTDESGNPIQSSSLLKQYNGHYFVNVTLSKLVLYPCTATLTGTAYVKTYSGELDADAALAAAGTKVIADFSDWNGDGVLQFQGSVSGSAGAFTISNVPAVFNNFSESGTIGLYLVSENGSTTAVDSFVIDGSSSNASGTIGVGDGALLPGEARDIGKRYFFAAIPPKVVDLSPVAGDANAKFDPGTSGTPTPLVFTFDKPMNTTKGTLTIQDSDESPEAYYVGRVWTGGGTVLTVTPTSTNPIFQYGTTLTASFSGFESADGVPFSGGPYDFYVRDALALLTSTTYSPYGEGGSNLEFPVANDVVLVFNAPIVSFDPAGTYILRNSDDSFVPSAITISGSTLTFNPTANLDFGTTYRAYFKVNGTLFNHVDILVDSSGLLFATPQQVLVMGDPTISFDSTRNFLLHTGPNRTTFDSGDDQFYVDVAKITGATAYSLQYKLSTDSAWAETSTLGTPVAVTSTNNVYLVDLPTTISGVSFSSGLISGYAVQFRAVARTADGRYETISASPVSFADTVAPNNVSSGVVVTYLEGTANNSTGTVPGYVRYSVELATGEPVQDFAAGSDFGTLPANVTISSVGRIDTNTLEVIFQIATGQSAISSVVDIHVHDAAGNEYDNNNTTGGLQVFTYTLNN